MAEPLRAAFFGDDERDLRRSPDGESPTALEALNSNTVALSGEVLREPASNWPGAIKLVERAAAMIKDYEQKFKDVEADARAFMQRVDEEQSRLHAYIASLEGTIADLESNVASLEARGQETEAALHDVKIEAWEVKLKLRSTETRALEAEAETQRSNAYVRRVEELLRGI
jgi:chromosome segregation ATPase